ncbi:MAG TPA: hypothetical protein VKR06_10245 [Ktedonosporobacter sp.]|nr:hypothetical protein [Ktedonosporobacter sp.]
MSYVIVPDFTDEGFHRAEQLAIELMGQVAQERGGQTPTPVEALYALTHSFFCVLQGTNKPVYTEKEQNDLGIVFRQQYVLCKEFPYTAQQIMASIVQQKGLSPPQRRPTQD